MGSLATGYLGFIGKNAIARLSAQTTVVLSQREKTLGHLLVILTTE